MKLQFIDEYDELLTTLEADEIPSTFDSILLFEVMYYVRSVTWDISNKVILVRINEQPKTPNKGAGVFETAKQAGNNSEILALKKKLNEAIEDGKSLKRQVFSIKQHVDKIKTDIKKPTTT